VERMLLMSVRNSRDKAVLQDEGRTAFNERVYSPLSVAIEEYKKRKTDASLEQKVQLYLDTAGVPDILTRGSGIPVVLFRQIITPNYEVRRFISLLSDIEGLRPVFFEYVRDKFVPGNEQKYYWGRLGIDLGVGKKGGRKVQYEKLFDFQAYDGKPLHTIPTRYGETLSTLHSDLFHSLYPNLPRVDFFYDMSEWVSRSGQSAHEYYKLFFALFLRHGILFENFCLHGSEARFTREVVLPAFEEISNLFGIKPLVVALEPTEIEGESFWVCHPEATLDYLKHRGGSKI
jgi:hypothetical protein